MQKVDLIAAVLLLLYAARVSANTSVLKLAD